MKTVSVSCKAFTKKLGSIFRLALPVLLAATSSLALAQSKIPPPSDIHVSLMELKACYITDDPAKKMFLNFLVRSTEYDIIATNWKPAVSEPLFKKLDASDSTGAQWKIYLLCTRQELNDIKQPIMLNYGACSNRLPSPNATWFSIKGGLDLIISRKDNLRESISVTTDVDSHASCDLEGYTISSSVDTRTPNIKGEQSVRISIKGNNIELIRDLIISSEEGEKLSTQRLSPTGNQTVNYFDIDIKHKKIKVQLILWDKLETTTVPVDIKANLGNESHA